MRVNRSVGNLMTFKSLVQSLSCVVLVLLQGGCASSGPQRSRSFFQALELSRGGQVDQAREAFQSACSQNSTAACFRLGKDVRIDAPLSILQGATSDTGTEIVVLTEGKGVLPQVFLFDSSQEQLKEPLSSGVVEIPGGWGKLTQVRYEGLVSGVKYQLLVVGAAGELLDGRELQTLDISKKQVSFAVASCMENTHPLQKQMWKELLGHEPEMIFLIGDNAYSDTEVAKSTPAPPELVWKRYFETRRDLYLFKARRLVPLFAVWDDHDYGQNDGDRTYPYRAESRKIFQAFFGSADYPGVFDRGPGVASRLNAFGQRFFFLDNRTFRSPAGDRGGQTHFGVDQESWLFTDLFTSTPVWLISGDQFFGAYHKYESYEGRHPESFTRFIRRLKSQSSPVVFLSGDRHLAELMEIPADVLGYRTYEITSSSIHSETYPNPWAQSPNPRQLEGVAGVNNYAFIESEANGPLRFSVKVFGPDNRRLFSRNLELRK
jgi:alkaline phosphatase D